MGGNCTLMKRARWASNPLVSLTESSLLNAWTTVHARQTLILWYSSPAPWVNLLLKSPEPLLCLGVLTCCQWASLSVKSEEKDFIGELMRSLASGEKSDSVKVLIPCLPEKASGQWQSAINHFLQDYRHGEKDTSEQKWIPCEHSMDQWELAAKVQVGKSAPVVHRAQTRSRPCCRIGVSLILMMIKYADWVKAAQMLQLGLWLT